VIAETIATLPMLMYRLDDSGERAPLPEADRLQRLVHQQIAQPTFAQPSQVVAWPLSSDSDMARWAIM